LWVYTLTMFDPMKAFINLPTWLRLTLGLSLTAGMFLWIWHLSTEEEKHEATLLTVCWYDGQAHYPETAQVAEACPAGVELLEWSKQPKTVGWVFPEAFDTYRRSHRDAIAWVNKELGVVALVETDGPADITIEWGSANEGHGLMNTKHFKEGDTIRAVISVLKPGDIREWMLEEEHELLHALGLAHDRRGIMSKSLAEPDGQKAWLLHKRDRKALRELLSP
jgi:hypothetical protein